MKARLGILILAVLCLTSGCVAIPPLVNVQHRGDPNEALKSRVEDLERRVRELETKTPRP
jgi:hypothetical protein